MANLYENFYENIKEARMRLDQTVVLYDGHPYYLLTVCDNAEDGIFRAYLDKLGTPGGLAYQRIPVPYDWHDEEGITRGMKMDQFLKDNPDCGIIRKKLNSPLFNRFRPFPLGMCNMQGNVVYLERMPVRHTQQGLTSSMVVGTAPSYIPGQITRGFAPNLTSDTMCDTILGVYPSAQECLSKLKDKNIINTGAAFHREFAFVKGPVEDLVFLVYKSEIVGYLPQCDFSVVKLSSPFSHLKEVTSLLGVFEIVA